MGFGINNPLPQSLGAESRKAAKILTSFVKPNQLISYEEVIPPHVLHNAKGLCVITVLRAGFLFSGRAGSGLIVARLPDGTWSPPSAVMTAGAGAGGMIGADLTDFIFVLNNADAVKTFASAGTLTLGGNVSLAAGPLGRAGEASGAAGTSGVATVFSYAKTKGLYAGISLEGSVLVERKDANQKFYGRPVPAKVILSGRIPAPRAVEPLFKVLDSRAFRRDVDFDEMEDDFYDDMLDPEAFDDMSSVRSGSTRGGGAYGGGYGGRAASTRRSGRYADDYDDLPDEDDSYAPPSRRRGDSAMSRAASTRRSGRYADDYDYDDDYEYERSSPRRGVASPRSRDYTDDYDDYRGGSGAGGAGGSYRSRDRDYDRYDRDRDYDRDYDRYGSRDREAGRRDSRGPASAPPPKPKPAAGARGMQGIALYSFAGEEDGDLPFRKGDVINITAKSDSTDDWWTGEFGGKKGIFPANYVELV